MENQRILVVGGTGYIGKPVLARLIKEKINFKCLTRKPISSKREISWIRGDILDFSQISQAMKNIDLVIYLAALKQGSYKTCFKTNVLGLKNTIEAMKASNVKKIIYFSTKNVLLNKRDNYSETKKIAEKILLKSGLESVILRPDLVYGLDRENILSKIIFLSLKLGFFIIPGFRDKNFYPVNKQFLAELCINFVKKFKPGVYSVSGTQTNMKKLIKFSSSLAKKKISVLRLPLFLFESIEKLLPLSLSVFREDRKYSSRDIISRTLKQDISNLLNSKKIIDYE